MNMQGIKPGNSIFKSPHMFNKISANFCKIVFWWCDLHIRHKN